MSAGAAVTNLGSNFLERLGNQATYGFGSALRNNPGGGGASEATDAPRFSDLGRDLRDFGTTGAQGTFVGDQRQTWGGVAGLRRALAPGVNVGFSVDQSRTAIDVPLALQSATLDLTQFGFNASVDKGPWTWAIALVHGFGQINSTPRHRVRLRDRRLRRADRRRADRTQLLLEHGPEPHRAKGRVRICARRRPDRSRKWAVSIR